MKVLNVVLGVLLLLGNVMALGIWWWLIARAVSRLWEWGQDNESCDTRDKSASQVRCELSAR